MKVDWVPFGEVASLRREQVKVDVAKEYQEIGIRSFGRGCFIKDPLRGIDLGSKRVYWINDRDLLFSNVFAWEGAVAVADTKHNGLIGSHRFMTWECATDRATPEFLRNYFLSDRGLKELNRASPGSAGRNKTLSISNLKAIFVPVPSLSNQDRVTEHLGSVARHNETTEKAYSGRAELSAALLPRFLSRLFEAQGPPAVPLSAIVTPVHKVIQPTAIANLGQEFVGLEHIEPHIGTRIGSQTIAEPKGRKISFRSGDVTYGYLRPYQNKVWHADQDGLCSVEQYVLRPNEVGHGQLLSALLRSSIVLDASIEATNNLQLPRLGLGKLLRIDVPDIREIRDIEPLESAIRKVTRIVVSADKLRSRRDELAAALLPAARNEIFNAMR